jgi:hypothetical protein
MSIVHGSDPGKTFQCADANSLRQAKPITELLVSPGWPDPWASYPPISFQNCRSLSVRQMMLTHHRLFLHTWCPSLLSNVYIPRLLLNLSCALLSFASLARFVPLFGKRRCFREWRQRQVFSCSSADKSEDRHAKKTSNPVR